MSLLKSDIESSFANGDKSLPSTVEINKEMLTQLLEMDDDESHEFSRGILDEFFEQVEKSIPQFYELITLKDYKAISELGHYLKGSAANVGATTIRNICEKLNYLNKNDPNVDEVIKKEIISLSKVTPKMKVAIYNIYK